MTGKPRTPYERRAPRSACDKLKGAAPPRVQDHAVPAWGAEVVSSNIVGYEKVTLNPGFNMIGVQFVTVGDQSAQDLSTATQLDSTMEGFDEDGNYATYIKVYEGGGNYTTYGWSGTSGEAYMEDATLNNKWLTSDYEEPEGETMDKGDAAWIIAGSSGTMTVAGEVPSANTIEKSVAAGFNMVANPYPGTVTVADFGILDSSFAGFDEDGEYKNYLKVYVGGGNYKTFGWSGTSGTDYLEDPTLDNKWLNSDYEKTDDTVDFGHGVWLITEKSGTITFTSPAAQGN